MGVYAVIIFNKGFPDTHDNISILSGVPVEAHRQLLSGEIVNAYDYIVFYIHEDGRKAVEKINSSWQELKCAFDDELIKESGTWRIKSDADKFNEIKHEAKNTISLFTTEARAKLTNYADQYKLAGWNDKSQRAQRVMTNTASDTDIAILQAECDKRAKSETPQALAQKQSAKAKVMATAMAMIDGMESAALEAIASKRSENTLSALLDQLQTQANTELNHLLGE